MTGTPNSPPWLRDFDVPGDPTGAVIAIDFGADGLWAGRVERGAVVAESVEHRITPQVLDVRMATYLRDVGRVDVPDGDVFGELVRVSGHARESLAGRETVLSMGEKHLRLVSVHLTDVMEATVPEINRAHGMVIELADRDPVDAVLLGPGNDEWPGLWESLTERGYSVLTPGDPFPQTFGGSDHPTEMIGAVSQPQQVLAWAASDEPGLADPALVDPADYGADRFEPDADPEQPASPRPRRAKLLVVTAVVLAAVGGGGVALAMNAQETHKPSVKQADAVSSSSESVAKPTTPEPEHVDAAVDPSVLAAAKVPVLKYTTPPPPPPPPKPTRTRQATPGPSPTQPSRPHRRTIPNPIPGLPPIVIG